VSAIDKYLEKIDGVIDKYVQEYEKTYGKGLSFEDVLKIMQWLKEKHPEVMPKLEELFLRSCIEGIREREKQKASYVS
jgi:hypothetical protein